MDDEIMMIGCLSGAVFALGLPMCPTEPVLVFEVDGSVTTMRSGNGGEYLILSTTSGLVYVYSRREESIFELIFKNMLHPPAESSVMFGSLRKDSLTQTSEPRSGVANSARLIPC